MARDRINWGSYKLISSSHCASGVNWSVAVRVAYLMIEQQYTFKGALNLIQNQKMLANPNLGFKKQLRLLETTEGDIQKAIEVHQSQNYDVVEDYDEHEDDGQ